MEARLFLAKITRVIDGDTFEADIDLGFFIHHITRFRLMGVDTPEITGVNKADGFISTDYVRGVIEGKEFWIKIYKLDKYGRYVADIYPWGYGDKNDMKSLSNDLIERGLARRVDYD